MLHDRWGHAARYSHPNSYRCHRAEPPSAASRLGSSIRRLCRLQTTTKLYRHTQENRICEQLVRLTTQWRDGKRSACADSRLRSRAPCQPAAVPLQTSRNTPHRSHPQCKGSLSSSVFSQAYAWPYLQAPRVCRNARENCCDKIITVRQLQVCATNAIMYVANGRASAHTCSSCRR